MMRTKEFLRRLEHERIVGRSRRRKRKPPGEIRVYIQRGESGRTIRCRRAAAISTSSAWRRRGSETPFSFLSRRARKSSPSSVTKAFTRSAATNSGSSWSKTMREHFQDENFTDALVEAIEKRAASGAPFSRKPDDRDELPDQIIEGVNLMRPVAAVSTIGVSEVRDRRRSETAATANAACKAAAGVHSTSRSEFLNVAPLVPGFPSLDVKPHSPGETRRFGRKKSEGRSMKGRQAYTFRNS